jgi:hypothetical protein
MPTPSMPVQRAEELSLCGDRTSASVLKSIRCHGHRLQQPDCRSRTANASISVKSSPAQNSTGGKVFVPILYRNPAFEAFEDFSDFVESISCETSESCQVRGSNPCRGAIPLSALRASKSPARPPRLQPMGGRTTQEVGGVLIQRIIVSVFPGFTQRC